MWINALVRKTFNIDSRDELKVSAVQSVNE